LPLDPVERPEAILCGVAGYSGTPLATKLGIKAGMTVAAVRAPDDFAVGLAPLPEGVTIKRQLRGPADLAVAFFTRRSEVTTTWDRLTSAVGPEGTVWVAWPKKASGVATDLTEDVFRTELLPTGWVDIKVCAIDATWSGLKFVLRKELRPKR
jgi:hypothetical protein